MTKESSPFIPELALRLFGYLFLLAPLLLLILNPSKISESLLYKIGIFDAMTIFNFLILIVLILGIVLLTLTDKRHGKDIASSSMKWASIAFVIYIAFYYLNIALYWPVD